MRLPFRFQPCKHPNSLNTLMLNNMKNIPEKLQHGWKPLISKGKLIVRYRNGGDRFGLIIARNAVKGLTVNAAQPGKKL